MVSKDVNIKMKTCKDFNIELCSYCDDPVYSGLSGCFIEHYRIQIEESITSSTVKKLLFKYIMSRPNIAASPRLITALEEYYPKYAITFQNMLLLK